MNKRKNSILFWTSTIIIMFVLLFTLLGIARADERDWQEKLDRMNIELAQKLQREPIEVPDLKGAYIGGGGDTVNVVNNYTTVIKKVVNQTINKNYITNIVNKYITNITNKIVNNIKVVNSQNVKIKIVNKIVNRIKNNYGEIHIK